MEMEQPAVSQQGDENQLTLTFSGAITVTNSGNLWKQALSFWDKYKPASLHIDASKLDACDGSGITLFVELQRKQNKHNKEFVLTGLPAHQQELFDNVASLPRSTALKDKKNKQHFLERLGRWSVALWHHILDDLTFMGALTFFIFKTIAQPHRMRWKDAWAAAEDVGPNAIFIVLIIGFSIGLIMAFQSAVGLQQFGAQIYVANLVGISMTRELGPLMTAILLSGRTASSFAAELGTMKINQEVDALTTMGLQPMQFLIMPRVFAAVFMTPILNVFMILFSLIGCGIVMETLGFSVNLYINQLLYAITMSSFLGGMFKAFVFGIIIAAIGCKYGLTTGSGASAVGRSTTKAVVTCIIWIAIVDGIFSAVYYVIGV